MVVWDHKTIRHYKNDLPGKWILLFWQKVFSASCVWSNADLLECIIQYQEAATKAYLPVLDVHLNVIFILKKRDGYWKLWKESQQALRQYVRYTGRSTRPWQDKASCYPTKCSRIWFRKFLHRLVNLDPAKKGCHPVVLYYHSHSEVFFS